MGRRCWQYRCGILAAVFLLATACAPTSDIPPQSKIENPTFTPFQPLPPGTDGPFLVSTAPALTATPSPRPATVTPEPATPTEAATETPTRSPTAPPRTAEASFSLWVDPLLPPGLQEAVRLPPEVAQAEAPEGATLRLEAGAQRPVSQWAYALVAPFPSIPEGTSAETLRSAWRGEVGLPSGQPLLVDESSLAILTSMWGEPGPQAVQVVAGPELLDYAWKHRPAWAIVPFEALEPRWKVLAIDGQSPLHKDFDLQAYPLTVPVSLNGDPTLAEAMRTVHGKTLLPANNRDPQRLSIVAMTGVTALVRGTAFAMERKGILYPAGDVGALLRAADLTHVSNEVPFAEDCPYPDPFQADMRFCSSPRYIELLEAVGADIIELTGDHFQDWGKEAMVFTLDLYRQRNWLHYGGGQDLEDARRAILVEHNGNRLVFIGCNAKGGAYAQAAARQPGAAACGYEFMENEIARLRGEGYLPIATFQHVEYYTYPAQTDQQGDFRRMAKAGAVVVSGSQAHQPQALEFLGETLIHYGLGNLFFDQYDVSEATRQAFIDLHVFYDGRYLSSELVPILFIDYARPRLMTDKERQELLEAVFAASGW